MTFAIAIALLIRMVACEPFQIEGPSMEPSLLDGDRVIVSKFAYGLTFYFVEEALLTWGTPELGDVVILTSTAADRAVIVKRVVGLPGDVIQFKNDRAFRNGEPLRVSELGHCAPGEQKSADPSCRVRRKIGDHSFRSASRRLSTATTRTGAWWSPTDTSMCWATIVTRAAIRGPGPIPVSRVKGRVEPSISPVTAAERRTDRVASVR